MQKVELSGFGLQILQPYQTHLPPLYVVLTEAGFKIFHSILLSSSFLPDALKTLSSYNLSGGFQDQFPFLLDCMV